MLKQKLAQYHYQGYCVLERWEILLEFPNRERITDAVWVSIRDMYDDIFGEPHSMHKINCDDTTTPQKFILFNKKRADSLM